jgi:hypothetical protein
MASEGGKTVEEYEAVMFAEESTMAERADACMAAVMTTRAYSSDDGLAASGERAVKRVLSAKVVEAFTAALGSEEDADVVGKAALCVAVACMGGANGDALLASGAMASLIKILQGGGKWRRAEAAWALGNLAKSGPAQRRLLIESKVLGDMAALFTDADPAHYCWATWAVLEALKQDEALCVAAADQGVLSCVDGALRMSGEGDGGYRRRLGSEIAAQIAHVPACRAAFSPALRESLASAAASGDAHAATAIALLA